MSTPKQVARLKERLIQAVINCPNKEFCKLVQEGKLKPEKKIKEK